MRTEKEVIKIANAIRALIAEEGDGKGIWVTFGGKAYGGAFEGAFNRAGHQQRIDALRLLVQWGEWKQGEVLAELTGCDWSHLIEGQGRLFTMTETRSEFRYWNSIPCLEPGRCSPAELTGSVFAVCGAPELVYRYAELLTVYPDHIHPTRGGGFHRMVRYRPMTNHFGASIYLRDSENVFYTDAFPDPVWDKPKTRWTGYGSLKTKWWTPEE